MITYEIWRGETVAIFGGGPSLTSEDVDYCKGKVRTIAINNAYLLAPWADVLYACDSLWWSHHQPYLAEFTGQKWTCSKEASDRYRLNHVAYKFEPSVSFRPGIIHLGSNSGFQALNLAVLFGVRRIILLGYDMSSHNGKTHWHGSHPPGLRKSSDYRDFIAAFDEAFWDLTRAGVDVINCSRFSKLMCFRRGVITDVI